MVAASQWQNVQEIPITLREFALTPFRGDFVIQNRGTEICLFVDGPERILVERLQTGATLADLIQHLHRSTGVYSYKKVVDVVVRLLQASFLTPDSESALLQHDFFKPFAPERETGRRLTFRFDRLGHALSPLVRWIMWGRGIPLASLFLLAFLWDLHVLFFSGETFDLMSLEGRHAPALGLWIAAFAFVVMLKNGFKFLLLKSRGLEAAGSGIGLRRGIPFCRVNDAEIVTQGWWETLQFHLICLFFPAFLAAAGLVIHSARVDSGVEIWAGACLLWILLDLSPFLRGEMTKAADRLSGTSRLWETVTDFLRRKLIRRIFSFGSTFGLEVPLIGFGVYAVLWLFASYKIVGFGLGRQFDLLSDATVLGPSMADRAAAGILIAGILLPFFSLIFAVLRLVLLNLYSILEKFIHRLTGPLLALRRKHALAAPQIAEFLRALPLFAGLPEDVRARLAASMRVEFVPAGRKVVWQGDRGESFYVIYQGEAEVWREEESGRRVRMARLSVRDSFGETALLEDVPRTATVEAATPLVCLVLGRDAFAEFVRACPQDKDQIVKVIRWTAFLKKVPMFSDLPPELMTRVVLEMKEKAVRAGEAAIREGDAAGEFFVLHTGAMSVWKDHGRPSAKQLAKLSAGDHFGEIALFDRSPRTASVVADVDSSVLVMPREAFFEILRTSVFSGVWIEAVVRQRKREQAAAA